MVAKDDENTIARTERLLLPQELSEYSRLSVGALSQLRHTGKGPRFLKPTAKTVLYRESDVIAWLEGSARTSTASV